MFLNPGKKTKVYNFIKSNKISEGSFFDIKNFRYFVSKYNLNFYFFDYKKILSGLLKTSHILRKAHRSNNKILFVGLHPKDSRFHSRFNYWLKSLALRNGHLYVDQLKANYLYDHYSFFKRKDFCPRKEKSIPSVLFVFSRSTNEDIYKEFSFAGVPSFYFFKAGSDSNVIFKDFPLFGIYSKRMLSFYLDFLNYSFRELKKDG